MIEILNIYYQSATQTTMMAIRLRNIQIIVFSSTNRQTSHIYPTVRAATFTLAPFLAHRRNADRRNHRAQLGIGRRGNGRNAV